MKKPSIKHFQIIESSSIKHGTTTLAFIRIASKETGEVFEATGIAKRSPEDLDNSKLGMALAMKRAVEAVGKKAYRSTLKLAEKLRKDAEDLSDKAMESACSVYALAEQLNLVVLAEEVKDLPIE